jgi:hypothetical protein
MEMQDIALNIESFKELNICQGVNEKNLLSQHCVRRKMKNAPIVRAHKLLSVNSAKRCMF